ncbi:hypothetical protein [Gordonia neofelifaecis]|uniref:Mce-associated membrane protein n=1 Tax=Gordonia neofelifaecis NRRL B-59395 TaxID=644548 RepID=F1YNW7_9ACTN|nr:hypothetical protein [Gordonia neofelifaecis]EGD53586.1 hypothetical protein SCNU_18082 [Gordonia neofelifaecis NRRL B-59395]
MGAHSAGEELVAEEQTETLPEVRPSGLWSRWRAQVRADRRWQVLWAIVVAAALVVGAVCLYSGLQSRAEPVQPDHTAVQAAADGVAALMTFSPDDTPQQRTEVEKHLTGTLAADYAARGPDVVFPEAVASKISMKTTVSSAAPGEEHDQQMSVLVFATQEVVVGKQQDYPTRIGIARWATVTKVGDVWRLSRVENVSPQ